MNSKMAICFWLAIIFFLSTPLYAHGNSVKNNGKSTNPTLPFKIPKVKALGFFKEAGNGDFLPILEGTKDLLSIQDKDKIRQNTKKKWSGKVDRRIYKADINNGNCLVVSVNCPLPAKANAKFIPLATPLEATLNPEHLIKTGCVHISKPVGCEVALNYQFQNDEGNNLISDEDGSDGDGSDDDSDDNVSSDDDSSDDDSSDDDSDDKSVGCITKDGGFIKPFTSVYMYDKRFHRHCYKRRELRHCQNKGGKWQLSGSQRYQFLNCSNKDDDSSDDDSSD